MKIMTIRLEDDLMARLDAYAYVTGTPKVEVIRQQVEQLMVEAEEQIRPYVLAGEDA